MGDLSPVILLDNLREELKVRSAEESLYEFVKQSWHVVEPGVEFVHGWHLQIICEHLEAITHGDIRRLLINIPPRHAKSTIVSVMWPCWEWITRPQEKYLCASYSGILSTRDNLKARRLITSPWYAARWGDKYGLCGDQNQKTRFENDKTGYRIASSVGGTATGEGGSRLILDDPHGAQDAQSDTMRESSIEWFDMVWSTRLNDPKRDSMVTIMQRLHESDVSGRILELGGWEHLCLPAEYDKAKRKTSIFVEGYDPRSKEGDLLWPERFGKTEIKNLKSQLGEYGVAGQLQQQPAPVGGGILKVDHFQLWPNKKGLPVIDYVVQSVDPAYTEKTTNDPTAFCVWGVFTDAGKRGAILLDCWADHLAYPQLRSKLVEEWHATYGKTDERKGKKADCLLIEAKASGLSLIQDLRQANLPAVPYNPGNADKINRAHQAAPILELDCLYIPESGKEPGEFVTWARPFVAQLSKFPNAEHDDMVDTFTQCIIYLRDMGKFELDYAPEDPVEEIDYHSKRRSTYRENPYDA